MSALEVSLAPGSDGARPLGLARSASGLLSLTVAALRLAAPWAPAAPPRPADCIITLDEVSWHDSRQDCWIVLYDRVYDITDFLETHPGGADVLLDHAGRDATVAFRGSGHSAGAVSSLHHYQRGRLPAAECIYRKPGGILLSQLPE